MFSLSRLVYHSSRRSGALGVLVFIGRRFAQRGCSSVVEHLLAKERVESSNFHPLFKSQFYFFFCLFNLIYSTFIFNILYDIVLFLFTSTSLRSLEHILLLLASSILLLRLILPCYSNSLPFDFLCYYNWLLCFLI